MNDLQKIIDEQLQQLQEDLVAFEYVEKELEVLEKKLYDPFYDPFRYTKKGFRMMKI
jgi:hypothetical protein